MSHWRDLLMLNTLRAPVIFIRIRIRILHVQSADPHYTRSLLGIVCSLANTVVSYYLSWLSLSLSFYFMSVYIFCVCFYCR